MSANASGSLNTSNVSSSWAMSSGLDQDSGSVAVASDDDSLVLMLNAVDHLAEVIANSAKRLRAHGHNCGWLS
jgi:hypothetical protein